MAKRFVIEKIDVDGDGIPDGDLVKEYEGDKLLSQKFVPKEKMAEIVDNALNQPKSNSGPKEKIIYKNEPQNIDNKPIVIKDDTNFAQFVKAGIALEVGREVTKGAVELLFIGLLELFSNGGGRKRNIKKRSLNKK